MTVRPRLLTLWRCTTKNNLWKATAHIGRELLAITFRCRENKYLVIGSAFYNKPRTQGTSADNLWEVQNSSNEYGDVQPNTVGSAAMKVACS